VDLEDKTITNTEEIYSSISNIKIYPNPIDDLMFVHSQEQSIISIHDLDGKLLNQFDINQGENKIELSGIKSGLYYVKTLEGDLLKILKL